MSGVRFRTRIKFCGLTRAEDVRIACDLGVDAIGLVFAARSKRRLDLEQAAALRLALDPMIDAVALFMDNTAEEVDEVIRSVQPSLLQFHGSEADAFCRSFGRPYLKAIAMGDASATGVSSEVQRYPAATGFLFDSHRQGAAGGSGLPFDWSRLPKHMDKPFLLAGGLAPDNVFEAIRATSPWGVDVSSGIERSPGIKDGDRMRRFVEEVRRADSQSG